MEFFFGKFDFQELEKNVQRVKDLLATIQEKAASLRPIASDAQKTALDKVDEMSGEVDQFQQKVFVYFIIIEIILEKCYKKKVFIIILFKKNFFHINSNLFKKYS